MVSLPPPNARTESSPLPNAISHAARYRTARVATMSLPPPPMMLPDPPEREELQSAPRPTSTCSFASLLPIDIGGWR